MTQFGASLTDTLVLSFTIVMSLLYMPMVLLTPIHSSRRGLQVPNTSFIVQIVGDKKSFIRLSPNNKVIKLFSTSIMPRKYKPNYSTRIIFFILV